MKAVVFLGPSLAISEAQRILPDAIYLPPARQSDLLSAAINLKPDVIGLIDGVFLQSTAVWHKEILYALQRGVHVYGASSMGALRAAETDRFGMIGVGEIYRMFASGELIDDEEVALSHGPAELGYRKLSEPTVNVRATLQAARDAGVIDAELCEQLVAIAKEIYFGDRIFPVVFDRALRRGVPAEVVQRLSGFVRTGYVDLKACDARLLLQTLRDLPEPLAPPHCDHVVARTSGFETMYNRDRAVPVAGVDLPLAQIANHVAVHAGDFASLNFNALNRALGVALARLLHVEVSADEIDDEAVRFRQRHGIGDEEAFHGWLERNHLAPDEFRLLMKEAALCRRLHRWLIYARWTERTTRFVLDYLRWENRYEEWAQKAATQERLFRASDQSLKGIDPWLASTSDLVAEQQEWSDLRVDTDLQQWAEEAGFHSKRDLKMELLRARIARRKLLSLLGEWAADGPDFAEELADGEAEGTVPARDAGSA